MQPSTGATECSTESTTITTWAGLGGQQIIRLGNNPSRAVQGCQLHVSSGTNLPRPQLNLLPSQNLIRERQLQECCSKKQEVDVPALQAVGGSKCRFDVCIVSRVMLRHAKGKQQIHTYTSTGCSISNAPATTMQ